MKPVTFTLPMRIFPKYRPRTVEDPKTGKKHTFTPKDDRTTNLIHFFFQFTREYHMRPLAQDLRVDCIYFCTGRSTCDKDNADKAIHDCGEGLLWVNDKQIQDGRTRFIHHQEKDSIQITISEDKQCV